MQHRLPIFSIILTLLTTLSTFAKHNGRYLNELSLDYKTAHLNWGEKLPGKKLNVLFIVPLRGGREPIELIQRLPMNYQAVTASNANQLSNPTGYSSTVEGTGIQEKKQELLRKLKAPYDLIVLGNINFDRLPAEAKLRLLSHVAEGTGLMMIFPRQLKPKKILSKPIPDGSKTILQGISKAGFPKKIQNINNKDLIKTFTFGKGRLCLVDWKANHSAYWAGNSLTAPTPYSQLWQAEYENMMVLILRALAWTSNRTDFNCVTPGNLTGNPTLHNRKIKLSVKRESTVNLTYRIRDTHNLILKEKTLKASGGFTISCHDIPAGQFMLDFIAKNDSGETVDLGFFSFQLTSPLGKLKLTTKAESIHETHPIQAILSIENAPKINTTIFITLEDSPYGRIWYQQNMTIKAGQTKLAIKIPHYYMPTLAGLLKCKLIQNGHTIAKTSKVYFFPQKKQRIYSNIYWGHAGSSYLGALYASQLSKNLGWKSCLSYPSKDGSNARTAAMLDQYMVPYLVRIMLLSERKDRTKQGWTQQGKWFLPNAKERIAALAGDQSFYNPKTKKLWADTVAYRMKNLHKYGSTLYSLGDENCYQYNAGFSPSDNQQFKKFLSQRYGTVQHLNKIWETNYKQIADAEHMTLKQAKARKCYPAWFDHRLFVEKQYADLHHFLAAEVRKGHPGAMVGAEGAMPGNLEETIKGLDFWGPYNNIVMSELLRSIGKDRIRGLWWGGYVASHNSAHDNYPFPLWKGLLLGTVNSNLWFEATNGGVESMMGADMSFAHYFRKMLPHLKMLNNGLAQLLINTPLENNGISILWDHASTAAPQLDPRFISPTANLTTFIKFCYTNGLNFDFTTPTRISNDLKNKKILFLFGISSLNKQTAQEIQRFAQTGGTVVADFPPALMDQYLKSHSTNPLADLFGNHLLSTLTSPPEFKKVDVNTSISNTPLRFKAKKSLTFPSIKQGDIRTVGDGKTVLLNFALNDAKHTQQADTSFETFLTKLLASAGVKPTISLSGDTTHKIIYRVRQGEGFKLVAILAKESDIGKNIKLDFVDYYYIYDTETGYITHDNHLEFKLKAPFKVFTLYEQPQAKPELSLTGNHVINPSLYKTLFTSIDNETKQGSVSTLNIAAPKQGAIYFLQVISPVGNPLPLRNQVIICNSKQLSFPVHFAYNDPEGNYIIKVVNINTGMNTTLTVELKQ